MTFEVIVGDDGSAQATTDAVAEFAKEAPFAVEHLGKSLDRHVGERQQVIEVDAKYQPEIDAKTAKLMAERPVTRPRRRRLMLCPP